MNDTMVLLLENHFNEIYRKVKSFAARRNHPSPEDAASEAIASALRNSSKFEGDLSNLISYICTITHYDVIDAYNSKHSSKYTNPVSHDYFTTLDVYHFDQYFKYQYLENIKELIQNLTHDESQIVIAKYVYDMNDFQIAELLNKSYQSIRVSRHRAFKKIKHNVAHSENSHFWLYNQTH